MIIITKSGVSIILSTPCRSGSLKIIFLGESLSKFCMQCCQAKLYTLPYNVTIYIYYDVTMHAFCNTYLNGTILLYLLNITTPYAKI